MSTKRDIDDYWRIDGIVADGHTGAPPIAGPGKELDYSFRFQSSQIGADGWPEHMTRFRELRELGRQAGSVVVYPPNADGESPFRETHYERSLIVSVRPPRTDPVSAALWGAITDVDAPETQPQSTAILNLSVSYIAPYERYTDRDAVRSALARQASMF